MPTQICTTLYPSPTNTDILVFSNRDREIVLGHAITLYTLSIYHDEYVHQKNTRILSNLKMENAIFNNMKKLEENMVIGTS